MKVGIKYCGGCFARYDRALWVSGLIDRNPGWDTEPAQIGPEYDVLYVVCGCERACVDYSRYRFRNANVVSTVDGREMHIRQV